ncbi:MAG: hypothetical protein V4722_26145 [Bacteroidota bacterium]
MKNFILSLVLLTSLISCSKEAPEEPDSETTTIPVTIAAVVTDPVNYPPSVSKILTNAIQLNYGAVKVARSMNLSLSNVTPEIMSTYSVHIYLKSGNKYVHLPGTSALGTAYNYSLKAAYPFCNLTVTRAAGTGEVFDDVIIVLAKNTILLSMTPSLNFTDYNAVKTRLGL